VAADFRSLALVNLPAMRPDIEQFWLADAPVNDTRVS
jgi:hypothetical protein